MGERYDDERYGRMQHRAGEGGRRWEARDETRAHHDPDEWRELGSRGNDFDASDDPMRGRSSGDRRYEWESSGVRDWAERSGHPRDPRGSSGEREAYLERSYRTGTPSFRGSGGRTRDFAPGGSYEPRSYEPKNRGFTQGWRQDATFYGRTDRPWDRDRADREQDRGRFDMRDDSWREAPHREGWAGRFDSLGQNLKEGIRKAFRGLKGYKRSDERVREDVCDRMNLLSERFGMDLSEVEVRVHDGEVTLTGIIADRQHKHLLENEADSVSGVRDVQNQIRVRFEGSEPSSFTSLSGTSTSVGGGTMGSENGNRQARSNPGNPQTK
jgi:hypothetical protein